MNVLTLQFLKASKQTEKRQPLCARLSSFPLYRASERQTFPVQVLQ